MIRYEKNIPPTNTHYNSCKFTCQMPGGCRRRSGLISRLARCFVDTRKPHLVVHDVKTLIGQRIFGIAMGYEDLNDHDTLRHDPTIGVTLDQIEPGLPLTRFRFARARYYAGLPVLHRLPSSARADTITPVGAVRCSCRLSSQTVVGLPLGPGGSSPTLPFSRPRYEPVQWLLVSVVSNIAVFEACSMFTHVPTHAVAELLNATLCRRSASVHVAPSMSHSGCYQPKRQLMGGLRIPPGKRAFPRRTQRLLVVLYVDQSLDLYRPFRILRNARPPLRLRIHHVQLPVIRRNLRVQALQVPFHGRLGMEAAPVRIGLHILPVNRHPAAAQQRQLAAHQHELPVGLLEYRRIVLAKIRNRLVTRPRPLETVKELDFESRGFGRSDDYFAV